MCVQQPVWVNVWVCGGSGKSKGNQQGFARQWGGGNNRVACGAGSGVGGTTGWVTVSPIGKGGKVSGQAVQVAQGVEMANGVYQRGKPKCQTVRAKSNRQAGGGGLQWGTVIQTGSVRATGVQGKR